MKMKVRLNERSDCDSKKGLRFRGTGEVLEERVGGLGNGDERVEEETQKD